MLDIKEMRKDFKGVETKLKNKVPEVDLGPVMALDEKIRALQTELDELKAQRNHASKEIGQKKQKGEDTASLMSGLSSLSDKISAKDHEATKIEETLRYQLAVLPNLPMDDIPISPS